MFLLDTYNKFNSVNILSTYYVPGTVVYTRKYISMPPVLKEFTVQCLRQNVNKQSLGPVVAVVIEVWKW